MAYVSDTGKRTAPKRQSPKAKPHARNAPHSVQTPPGGDIASSGGDYGTRQAKRYQASRAGRKAVRQTYTEQSPARRKQIATATKYMPDSISTAIQHEHISRTASDRHAAGLDRPRGLVPGLGQYEQQRKSQAITNLIQHLHKTTPISSTGDTKSDLELATAESYKSTPDYQRKMLSTAQEAASRQNIPGAVGPAALLGGVPYGTQIGGVIGKGLKTGLPQLGSALAAFDTTKVLSKTVGTDYKPGWKNLPANAVKEALDMPAQTIPSVYQGIIKPASKGDFNKVVENQLEFPKQLAAHPLRTLQTHPVGTALTVYGPLKGASNILRGGAVKAGAIPAMRPDAVFPNTGIRVPRETSRGIVGAVAQTIKDKPVREGKQPLPLVNMRQKGITRTGANPIQHMAHEDFSATEHVRRIDREIAASTADNAIGKKPTAAHILASQNLVHNIGDVRAYHGRVQDYLNANKTKLAELKKQNAPKRDVVTLRSDIAAQKRTLKSLDDFFKKTNPETGHKFSTMNNDAPFPKSMIGEVEAYKAVSSHLQKNLGEQYGQTERLDMRRLAVHAAKPLDRGGMGAEHVKNAFLDTKTDKVVDRPFVNELKDELGVNDKSVSAAEHESRLAEFNSRIQRVSSVWKTPEGKILKPEDIRAHMAEQPGPFRHPAVNARISQLNAGYRVESEKLANLERKLQKKYGDNLVAKKMTGLDLKAWETQKGKVASIAEDLSKTKRGIITQTVAFPREQRIAGGASKESVSVKFPKLTGSAVEALRIYGGGKFPGVQRLLRGRDGNIKTNAAKIAEHKQEFLNVAHHLDEAIHNQNPLEHDIIVHRGVDGTSFTPEELAGMKAGEEITDKGFTSVSTDPKQAQFFTGSKTPISFDIHLPKGIKVLHRPGDEGELILPRNTTLKIISRKDKVDLGKGKIGTHIEAKAIGPNTREPIPELSEVKTIGNGLEIPETRVSAKGYRGPQDVKIPGLKMETKYPNQGISEPAFISHTKHRSSVASYFVNPNRPQAITPSGYTGKAIEQGLADLGKDVPKQDLVRAQGLVTAAERFKQMIRDVAVRRDPNEPIISESGDVIHDEKFPQVATYGSKSDAQRVADDLNDKYPDHQVVPVRVALNPSQQKEFLGEANDDAAMGKMAEEAILDALNGKEISNGGNWALMPKDYINEASKYISEKHPIARMITSQFRKTVLALSVPWLVGNYSEAAIRTALARVGPRSYFTGRHVLNYLKENDPQLYHELQSRAVGGGHYNLQRNTGIYTGVEHLMNDSGSARALGDAITALHNNKIAGPPARGIGHVWNAWTDFVFNKVNGPLESQFQTAMMGKAFRETLMDPSLKKLSKKAMEETIQDGKLSIRTADMLGRKVDEMYGKYSKFGPGTKKMIANATPFIAWYLNAVRFIYKTMPRDHPLVTSLINNAYQATEEWRKDKGLGLFLETRVPPFLQGSVPTDGGNLRFRYTPFSVMGDPLGSAAGIVFPQAKSVILNMMGLDWKGDKLKDGDRLEVRAGEAIKTLSGALIPGYTIANKAVNAKPDESTVQHIRRTAGDPFLTSKTPAQLKAAGGTKSKNPFDSSGQGSGSSPGKNPFDSAGGSKKKKKNPFDP